MYNAPRAATIITKTPGTLHSLDRITFSQIVKNAATKKRELYRKVIDSIDIFADVSSYEK
jgi:cAMP-dependent protein kinase regulator